MTREDCPNFKSDMVSDLNKPYDSLTNQKGKPVLGCSRSLALEHPWLISFFIISFLLVFTYSKTTWNIPLYSILTG